MIDCLHGDAIKPMDFEGKTYIVCHRCGTQFVDREIVGFNDGENIPIEEIPGGLKILDYMRECYIVESRKLIEADGTIPDDTVLRP